MRAALLASALGLAILAGCGRHDPSPPGPVTEPPAGEGGSEPSSWPPPPPAPPSPFTCKIEPDLPAPGGVASACAEAIVALGAPREVRIDVETTRAVRVEAAIDAAGTIAHYASWGNGGGGYWAGDLALVRPDGTIAHPTPAGAIPRLDPRYVLVTAGRDGFLAVDAIGEVTFFGSDGATVRHSRIPWPGELASVFAPYGYGGLRGAFPDGRGGAFVALVGAAGGGAALWLAHVGPDGASVAPPFTVISLPSEAVSDPYAPAQALGAVAVGEDGEGRILVTWDGGWAGCGDGTIAGRWFLPDGTPLGDVFRAGAGLPLLYPYWFTDARLVPLPDGSLALRRDDGTWARRFTQGALAGGPAPGWLAARPGEEVTSRDDGVLVFRRPAAEDGSGGRVDVVDGAGAVCAHVDLPGESPTRQIIPRARMTPAVGLDGTIVQLADVENDPLGTSVLRVWPGGLR